MVDDEDYEFLSQWKWAYDRSVGYAVSNRPTKDVRRGMSRKMYMHRMVLNTPDEYLTDHINGNRLDNTRSNLRICSQHENTYNSSSHKKTSSNYKGVHWFKAYNRWQAYINFNGNRTNIGYFDSEEEAARAYDAEAFEKFGRFAKLNFPNDDPTVHSPKAYSRSMSSQYRGVQWSKQKQRWHAQIWVNKKKMHIGFFHTEKEAAQAYNDVSLLHFGEHAKMNDVDIV